MRLPKERLKLFWGKSKEVQRDLLFWGGVGGEEVKTRSNSISNRAEPRKKCVLSISPFYFTDFYFWLFLLFIIRFSVFSELFILQVIIFIFFSFEQHSDNDTGSKSNSLVASFVGHRHLGLPWAWRPSLGLFQLTALLLHSLPTRVA